MCHAMSAALREWAGGDAVDAAERRLVAVGPVVPTEEPAETDPRGETA